MCCYANKAIETQYKKHIKGKEWIDGWKVIRSNCTPVDGNSEHVWKVGEFKENVKRYNTLRPRGFHFYLTETAARKRLQYIDGYRLVRVRVHVKSIVKIGAGHQNLESCGWTDCAAQAVTSRLKITPLAWEKSMPPKPKSSSKGSSTFVAW